MSDDEKQRPTPPNENGGKKIGPADQNVPAVIGEVLRTAGIDPGDPRFTRALEISLKLFSGSLPLPPAEYVEPWEKLIPGIGRQIVVWTEQQGDHRRRLETFRAERTEQRLDRGQFIAAAVALVGLMLSAFVAVNGATTAALGIALFSVGGPTACLAIASFWGRKR